MSQGDVSAPLTRSYVSQVEHGRVLPSIPALIVMAERLGTSADEVLRSVNRTLNSEYAARREDR
jgi:transcriptional regulator with XRE-family HTH domain